MCDVSDVCFLLQVLKERFGMVAPDVQIEDGKGTILISSEEGETEGEPGWVEANAWLPWKPPPPSSCCRVLCVASEMGPKMKLFF